MSDNTALPETPSSEGEAPGAPRSAEEALASEAALAMGAAWRTGQRVGVEELLLRYPLLKSSPQAVLRLISEELCLRHEADEKVDLEEIAARFPQWRAELEVLLACHDLFEAPLPPPDFPRPGECCGDFELLREIGRGSQGRVFLARQPSLSDRAVVVKLTALDVSEHLSLARLQHTGIVPLYLAQDLPERRLRLLCMPFMGGASLAAVLAAMKPVRIDDRSGKTIAEALLRCHIAAPSAPVGGPVLNFLNQATYVQAVCWIGASLAEALHYAHQRGLVHFDLKPSNLLLAGDGQPMLLDFHLARGPIVPGRTAAEWVGGTQQYMPPEQASALEAVRGGRPVPRAVDARADIYALGMILDEMLAGEGPLTHPAEGPYGLRHVNRHVTRGLADVLAKCLSPDPDGRYADAQSLADDLRRHLADLPLRGVRNRGLAERWRKWRRRRPQSAVRLVSSMAALAALAAVAWLWAGQRTDQSQLALVDGQQWLDRKGYDAAIDRLQRGLDALKPVPGAALLKRTLRERLDAARRAKLLDDLHQFVERLRFLDGGSLLAGERLIEAGRTCQSYWAVRDRLLDRDSQTIAGVSQASVQADLLDLVLFWIDIEARLAADDSESTRRALALLDEAEATLGPNEVLRRTRRLRAGANSAPTTTGSHPALPAAPEHNALGRVLLRANDERGALAEFRRAVTERPQDFWANYYRGRCAYRLALYPEALNAFCVCVALAPTHAECFYNRALTYAALDRPDAALADYDRALQLDPQLTAAAENRAALRRQIGSSADDDRDDTR